MRTQYMILNFLFSNDAKSKLMAVPLKEIQQGLASEGDSYCWRTIYNNVKELFTKGYIKEGLKIGNQKSYYVSIDGIKWMKEVEKEEEDSKNE